MHPKIPSLTLEIGVSNPLSLSLSLYIYKPQLSQTYTHVEKSPSLHKKISSYILNLLPTNKNH